MSSTRTTATTCVPSASSIWTAREKGRLRSPAIQHCLETLAAEAAVAIENARLYRESQEKARLDRDMHTAYQFQQGLLPKAPPLHDYFSAAAEMVPCLSIGGDFYDYVDLDGTFGFVLGDVAGKGAAAGLLGARVQEIFAFRAPGTDPATTIATINATMVKKGLPDLSRCSTASCRLAASSPTATPVTIHRCSSARTGYAGSRPTVSSSDYSMKPHTSRRSSP